MNARLAASFIAAVLLHAALLFGFRLETPARPLAMAEQPAMDVSLVEAAPEAPPPAAPESTPEPPAPQPTPEMSTPPPEPVPTPAPETISSPESTPAHAPRSLGQKRSRPAAPHPAAAVSGAVNRGAAAGPLNLHAGYLSNPKPDYPAEARRQQQQGVVRLSVEVDAEGRAAEVDLARSSGFPLLDAAAIQAVRRWRFTPARAAGLPVSSRVEVPVHFSLSR